MNLKGNTILGVNVLHEEDPSPKNKRQLDTSSLTGSMQMYFDSNKRKKIQHKLTRAGQLIKQNQERFINNIVEAIKFDKRPLFQIYYPPIYQPRMYICFLNVILFLAP